MVGRSESIVNCKISLRYNFEIIIKKTLDYQATSKVMSHQISHNWLSYLGAAVDIRKTLLLKYYIVLHLLDKTPGLLV